MPSNFAAKRIVSWPNWLDGPKRKCIGILSSSLFWKYRTFRARFSETVGGTRGSLYSEAHTFRMVESRAAHKTPECEGTPLAVGKNTGKVGCGRRDCWTLSGHVLRVSGRCAVMSPMVPHRGKKISRKTTTSESGSIMCWRQSHPVLYHRVWCWKRSVIVWLHTTIVHLKYSNTSAWPQNGYRYFMLECPNFLAYYFFTTLVMKAPRYWFFWTMKCVFSVAVQLFLPAILTRMGATMVKFWVTWFTF